MNSSLCSIGGLKRIVQEIPGLEMLEIFGNNLVPEFRNEKKKVGSSEKKEQDGNK